MHIYAFGSICRGEIDRNSDVDMLALVDGPNHGLDPNVFSIYSYARMGEIWKEGNPFAWHLSLEAKCIYACNGIDYLLNAGRPNEYNNFINDCRKFFGVFLAARKSLLESNHADIFDLSSIFLSIRNFATCYSLGFLKRPVFSRLSFLMLGVNSLKISESEYRVLERCRILCTRGHGVIPTSDEIREVMVAFDAIYMWMSSISMAIKEVKNE